MKTKKRPSPDLETGLDEILDGADPGVAKTARDLVALLNRHPDLTPKVQLGWRSVNFRHPKAGFVCAVFPQKVDTILVFENGRMLDNTRGLLEGDGLKKVRFVRLKPGKRIPAGDIGALLGEAIALRV